MLFDMDLRAFGVGCETTVNELFELLVLAAFAGAMVDGLSKFILVDWAASFYRAVAAFIVVFEPERRLIQPACEVHGLSAKEAYKPFLPALFKLLEAQPCFENLSFRSTEELRSTYRGTSGFVKEPFDRRA